jgi:hypothetical protein
MSEAKPTVAAAEAQIVAELIRALDREQLLRLAGLLLNDLAAAQGDQLTKAELRARSETLAGSARRAAYGRVVCPFCGKPKKAYALAAHIRRTHADRLVSPPPAPPTLAREGPRHAG